MLQKKKEELKDALNAFQKEQSEFIERMKNIFQLK